ncbi:MAG: PAS domain S-box protein [Gammaproteobacteria bacterium]|nr:PAS domain S-box protein [Gammaproteobacteria bacterium]
MTDKLPEKYIKTKVMALVLACLFVLVVLGIYVINTTSRKLLNDKIHEKINSVNQLFQSGIKEETKQLEAVMTLLSSDEKVNSLLKTQNKDALLNKYASLYQSLKQKFNITHFYFSNPDRVNILRVHAPSTNGDVINRFTTLQAEKNKTMFSGVELGKYGQLTLRLVKPVYEHNALIGFIEIGKEIEFLVENIQSAIDTEIFITISKKHLKKEVWLEGMELLNRPADWNKFPKIVLIKATSNSLVKSGTSLFKQHDDKYHILEDNISELKKHQLSQSMYLFSIPINEVSGREVGDLFFQVDISEFYDYVQNNSKTATLLGLAAIIIASLLIYWLLQQEQKALIRSRKELIHSSSSLQQAQKIAKLGSWELDLATNTVSWSDGIFRLFELDKNKFEATYDGFLNAIHPDDRDMVNQAYSNSLETKKAYTIEHRLLMSDSRVKWVRAECSTNFSPDGNPLCSLGTVQDITNQKQLSLQLTELSENQQKLIDERTKQLTDFSETQKQYLHTIQSILVILDRDGNITMLNPAAERQLGYSSSQLIGQNWFKTCLPQPQGYEEVLPYFKSIISGKAKNIEYFENEILTKEGKTLTVAWQNALLTDNKGNTIGIVSSGMDITKQKQTETELIKAKEIAEEATEAKSHFLANMSHEIRTPMNAIIGMTYLALQTELNERQNNYISKVAHSAESLLGLINDILDFSKIEAGKLDIESIEFSLDEVFQNLAGMLSLKAEDNGLELMFRLDQHIPDILIGDPLRLNQILTNLCNNAVKFTNAGGEVVVAVSLEHTENDKITLHFTVTDNGIGISEEHKKKLFQSFSQADTSTTRKHGGTGLGLAISKSLVEIMNGNIWLESSLDKGSSFHFTAQFNTSEHLGSQKKIIGKEIGALRILVVDDNKISREILSEMLLSFGFDCEQASSCAEALSLLEDSDQQNPFDLVLMDWNMPKVDGLQATHTIQESNRLKNIPLVIMVTAYNESKLRSAASSVDLADILTKPVTPYSVIRKYRQDYWSYRIGKAAGIISPLRKKPSL